MDAFLSWLQVYVLSWLRPPKAIEVIDIIQILLISWLVYRLILLVKNTRAYTLLKGILFIIAFVAVAYFLQMEVIIWLIGNLSMAAMTAVVIIFQPELRKVLEQMGHSIPLASFLFLNRAPEENKRFSDHTISELARACYEMGEVKTGALIVLERDTQLSEFENTGIPVDAVVSGQLIENIFEHNTPLHDGAVIIRQDRIAAATCYLPLSDNMELSKRFGTRHRAGVGISEVSDALVIIVSEETGDVSFARDGKLHPGISVSELRQALQEAQKYYDERANILKRRRGRRAKALS